ncbi:hypothetical protein CPB84DRAFT_1812353 [Gymnopilus junonius]|uniref:F-box domain-containing protein n=1 Tax=Gymnopilus junonius TaxID=109634 RepID=A0A9P5TTL9_GYMJU|nr:hypothetical protein CPB84DRAFT_1812353 [Gymnopilus junonius]
MAFLQTFPPEVWSQVLEDVPRIELHKFLGVCSTFHDIIIRKLFSSVKIYLIGGFAATRMLNTNHVEWIEGVEEQLMTMSWEVLNCICQEPRFARVVKSMTVIAYADGRSTFEKSNALHHIPNLQTFRWIGNGPPLDTDIAKKLPTTLKTLVIQSSIPPDSFLHLTNVTTLHLSMPFFFPDDEEAHDVLVSDPTIVDDLQYPIIDILEAVSPKLRSLRVTASQVGTIPIRTFSTLTELEIIATIGDQDELVGLDVVFRYASSLESLTLVGFFSSELFSFLPHSSIGNLPLLNSFRLSCEDTGVHSSGRLGEDEFQSLYGFLQGRQLLRRLYLRIPTLRWGQTSRFLFLIRELGGLEVLGFHTGRDILADEHIVEFVAPSLCSKLCALHLAMNWGGRSLLPLVDAIAKLSRLKFLHLYGTVTRLPILLDDLIEEAPGLEMVGLNRALWNIDRVGAADKPLVKLPRWKIKFCIEEDFLSPDDAWLFKYN